MTDIAPAGVDEAPGDPGGAGAAADAALPMARAELAIFGATDIGGSIEHPAIEAPTSSAMAPTRIANPSTMTETTGIRPLVAR